MDSPIFIKRIPVSIYAVLDGVNVTEDLPAIILLLKVLAGVDLIYLATSIGAAVPVQVIVPAPINYLRVRIFLDVNPREPFSLPQNICDKDNGQ